MPKQFWGEALITAVYLYNKTPHAALNLITLYKKKNNKQPQISHIKTFGFVAYYKIKTQKTKFKFKVNKAILLEFNENLYKL